MNVRLLVKSGGAEPKTYRMTHDEMVIGRLKGCGLRIPSASVSRRHCRLACAEGIVRVEDLGSANGTIVNGLAVKHSTLRPGDRLTIGPVTFEVQYALTPAAVDQLLNEDGGGIETVGAGAAGGQRIDLEDADLVEAAAVETGCPEAIPLDDAPVDEILPDLPLAQILDEVENEGETLAERPPPPPKKKKKKADSKDNDTAKKPGQSSPDYSVMMSDQEPWAMPAGDDLRDLLSQLEDEE